MHAKYTLQIKSSKVRLEHLTEGTRTLQLTSVFHLHRPGPQAKESNTQDSSLLQSPNVCHALLRGPWLKKKNSLHGKLP